MIPAFFSSAQMILLECHESPATNPRPPKLAKYIQIQNTNKIHIRRIGDVALVPPKVETKRRMGKLAVSFEKVHTQLNVAGLSRNSCCVKCDNLESNNDGGGFVTG
jgi:hypothetical protein